MRNPSLSRRSPALDQNLGSCLGGKHAHRQATRGERPIALRVQQHTIIRIQGHHRAASFRLLQSIRHLPTAYSKRCPSEYRLEVRMCGLSVFILYTEETSYSRNVIEIAFKPQSFSFLQPQLNDLCETRAKTNSIISVSLKSRSLLGHHALSPDPAS